ncbi:hypothetical protein AX16_003358 [Volvariella volvacea WC 439]|nr:hypothetical protein AX16_003358 [Volvariella volvacea WC 439]
MADIKEVIKTLKQDLSPKAQFYPPGSGGYNTIANSYFWGSSIQKPTAIFQPATAGDISLIMSAICRTDPTVTFAIRAGTHIAPKGFNSTTGLLIDLSLFTDVSYDDVTGLVDIGPGMLWQGVYDQLTLIGRNVNGATSCQGVGVAGFNLGGGYGNKANQYGLAMDTIKSIEVVLPSGEIKTVSEKSDSDLFWALKGGGNNFGIVTKWTMETHEQGDIYFKALNYSHEQFDRVQAAIWAYVQKQVPKSNVETKFEWSIDDTTHEVVAISHAELFYDGPEPPEDLFKEFLEIPSEVEKTTTTWRGLMDLLPDPHETYRTGAWASKEQRADYTAGLMMNLFQVNAQPAPKIQVNDPTEKYRGRYTCVMLSRYTETLIKRIVELAGEVAKGLKDHGGFQFYPDIWPGSPTMFKNSPPSAWPHGPEPLFPLPIRCIWKKEKNDQYWLDALASFSEKVRQIAIEEGCTAEDAPLYYNLALDGTDVSLIYRDNLPRLTDLRAKYDPFGVMNRTGGFRIPNTPQ